MHYLKRKYDLDERLYKMYDKRGDAEDMPLTVGVKKMAIETITCMTKITFDKESHHEDI